MKVLALILVVICGFCLAEIQNESVVKPRSALEDQVIKAIDKIKEQMPCGHSEIGLPVLAPYEREFFEVDYEKKLLLAIASLFDIRIDGLNKFDVNNIKISALTLKASFDITFTDMQVLSEYVANMFLLKFIKVSGKGDMDIKLRDLRITANAQLGGNSEGLYLKDFKIIITLGDFKSNITGLLWGKLSGKLANKAIEKFVPWAIKHQQDLICSIVEEQVIKQTNEMLKGVKIQDLLEMIKKVGESEWPECKPPNPKMFFM